MTRRASTPVVTFVAATMAAVLTLGCAAAKDGAGTESSSDTTTTEATITSSQDDGAKEESQTDEPAEVLEPRDPKANATNYAKLLTDLVNSYEDPEAIDEQAIEDDLDAIRAIDARDGKIAQSVVDNWHDVFANPDYEFCYYGGGETAPELEETGLTDSSTHAFVVLGYELKDGEMTEELMGRCEAAAAAARTFPSAIIVCSGGATGQNNPDKHTEAGMMHDYLVNECGIDEDRIHIDERAQDTTENAENTFEILRDNGIRTITIVTSSYHQPWVQAVYNAAAAISEQDYGYPIQITGNYSLELAPTVELYGQEDRIAVEQIAQLLKLPREAMDMLPDVIGE